MVNLDLVLLMMAHMRTDVSLLAEYHLSSPSSFSPFYKYGACSSAQDGGYLNVGTFNKQVDPTNGLSLVIQRGDDTSEQYQFQYFLIEII